MSNINDFNCQNNKTDSKNQSTDEVTLRIFYINIILDVVSKITNSIKNNPPSFSDSINMNGESCISWKLYSQDNGDYDDTSSSINLLPDGRLVDVINTWDGIGTFKNSTDLYQFISKDNSIFKDSHALGIICDSIIKKGEDFGLYFVDEAAKREFGFEKIRSLLHKNHNTSDLHESQG